MGGNIMVSKRKRKYSYLDLILIVNGKRFYGNVDSERDANIVVELLRKINKSTSFFIKEFSVGFYGDFPKGNIEKWRKEKGFSIWYAPLQKEVK